MVTVEVIMYFTTFLLSDKLKSRLLYCFEELQIRPISRFHLSDFSNNQLNLDKNELNIQGKRLPISNRLVNSLNP